MKSVLITINNHVWDNTRNLDFDKWLTQQLNNKIWVSIGTIIRNNINIQVQYFVKYKV